MADVPQVRSPDATAAIKAATPDDGSDTLVMPNDPEPGPPRPEGEAPEAGGQVAIFTFADGTKLDIEIPYAIGMGGGGDEMITKPWWRLRQKGTVLNEGPLLNMMRKA